MSSKRETTPARGMENVAVLRLRVSGRLKRAWSLINGNRDYVEELATRSDSGLSSLTQRRSWLVASFFGGSVATLLVWIAALRFPYAASFLFANFFNSNLPRYGNLITVLLTLIPFTPPFVAAFTLGNMLFVSSQESEFPSGMMATFNYTQKSNTRWLIVVVAGICGAMNCLLLLIVVTSATGH